MSAFARPASVRRLVVVTGGANGIGRAIVQAFASEGDAVIAADIDEKAGEELERDALSWTGSLTGPVKFIRQDFSKPTCYQVAHEAMKWAGAG